jgi:hypothetical protein
MKKLLILILLTCVLPVIARAQTFTTTATITITRKSDGAGATQNKADQALMRDIERYVVGVSGAIVNPTQKSDFGACLPYTFTLGNKTINVDIYNRDAETCAVAIVNGRTDLRSLNALSNILQRLIVTQFNFLTDAHYVQDAAITAAKAAETTAAGDAARTAEKVDPPN